MKIAEYLKLSLCLLSFLWAQNAFSSVSKPPKELSKESKQCIACHKKHNPGLIQEWGASKHYRANVGC